MGFEPKISAFRWARQFIHRVCGCNLCLVATCPLLTTDHAEVEVEEVAVEEVEVEEVEVTRH
jgi:hypothetical protein